MNDIFFIISDIDTIKYADEDLHILSNHWKKHLVLTYFKDPDKRRTLKRNNEKITTKFGNCDIENNANEKLICFKESKDLNSIIFSHFLF